MSCPVTRNPEDIFIMRNNVEYNAELQCNTPRDLEKNIVFISTKTGRQVV